MGSFSIDNYIALSSCVISLAALLISYITNKKTKALDLALKQQQLHKHEQEEIDNKKADMEVNVVDTPRGEMNILRFYNKGRVKACNVKFEITDDPEGFITICVQNDYLPYPILQPQQNFDIRFLNYGEKPHQTIKITWDDDFGKGRYKEMVVDM